MAYLDNAATTKVCEEAIERMVFCLRDGYGNPSSLHTMGFNAETEMENAREKIARVMDADPACLFFTSGGTEANNLAVLGAAAALARSAKKAVVSGVEHSSVAACFTALEKEGWEIIRVLPDETGVITPKQVEEVCDGDTVLVSVMAVNNETGARFDIPAIAKAVRRKAPNAIIHTDCVQAFGKIPIRVKRWDVDLLSVSSHKIHGPKGCGALYIRKGVRILPRQFGGLQEQRLRPGTQAVPAIVGFGAAAAALPPVEEQMAHFEALKATLIKELSDLPNLRWHLPQNGVPYIVNVSVTGFRSETLVHFLSERQVFVSSGSACSKGAKSPVLTAMGFPEDEIDSALRISFSRQTTIEEVAQLCAALKDAVKTLRRRNG